MRFRPEKLVIEEAVAETSLVQRVLAVLPHTPVIWVGRVKETKGPRDEQVLEIVKFRGRFIKPCPGTRSYICCGYQILNLGIKCSLGCTYCILQSYFPSPNLRLFANLEDMWQQLRDHLGSFRNRVHRFGTGEFTDSLLLDPLTHLSADLVPFFAGEANAILELKTKTTQVESLETLNHRGHTVVAWSLNPDGVIASEEAAATSLDDRLEAARRCQEWGYRIAFHFDPLLVHPNWQQNYTEVVSRLFSTVDPRGIAWISLGTLRFMPALKPIIQQRHPESTILHEEFVPGLDGKMRYFRDLRVEMYRHLNELLKKGCEDLCIYLCMESEDVWTEALGFTPEERGGLCAILDRQALP
ncbi:MAG: DNA photolyase [Deltaproteobacteria bacterium]|nr:MAG: DNA photolyase [Deltaproteobacteria bacterium]